MKPSLKDLREKAEKATPGPWEKVEPDRRFRRSFKFGHANWAKVVSKDHEMKLYGELRGNPIPDAEFIAAANPQTILALCDAIDEMAQVLQDIFNSQDPNLAIRALEVLRIRFSE